MRSNEHKINFSWDQIIMRSWSHELKFSWNLIMWSFDRMIVWFCDNFYHMTKWPKWPKWPRNDSKWPKWPKNDKHDQEMNQDLGKWFWRKNRSIQTVQKHLSPFVRAFTWAWVGFLRNFCGFEFQSKRISIFFHFWIFLKELLWFGNFPFLGF